MPGVYLYVTASAFFWGANFVLAGFVLHDLPPLWAAGLRFLIGAGLMFALSAARRETLLPLLARHAPTYLMLASVGIVGFNILFFNAMRETSAANAALVMATNPLLTTLLASVLLGERPSLRHLIALPVAFFGVAVVITQGKPASMHISSGDLMMLGANASWALYNVLGRKFMPKGSVLSNTTWISAFGAMLLCLAALASGTHFGAVGTQASLALAAMAVGGTVLAYLFWSIGILHLGAARTSIFLNLVPVFAMLLGLAFGTAPTSAQIAGGALVLGGVSLSMLPQRRLTRA